MMCMHCHITRPVLVPIHWPCVFLEVQTGLLLCEPSTIPALDGKRGHRGVC